VVKTFRQPSRSADLEVMAPEPVADDRKDIQPGDVVLLIVEDDRAFAGVILEAARRKGFKGVVAHDGRNALKLAAEVKPDAVTLDIHLPDMDGWGVLARLKNDPISRSIPVQIISLDEDRYRGLKQGAMAFLAKPVAREELNQALDALLAFRAQPQRSLLLLSSEKGRTKALHELLEGDDVKVADFKTGQEALAALQDSHFDCMVMEEPDKEAQVVLQALKKDPLWANLPIVVHMLGELPKKDETLLKQASRNSVVKEVRSPERLLDESALYLHRIVARLPEDKRQMIDNLHQSAPVLVGKRALVVDDDIRNIFAMTSLLEHSQMTVLSAESGADALATLAKNPDIDVVLMDIMMPEMDGYDTMKAIRKDERFRALPIIALTAKAMKGDRERCIEMGASDYITKPVDSDQLLSLMRLWLFR
jgi:CheY-like chemotaxis protein